mmetsp:Transcript_155581/g.498995  ORF Transcript_155581/g.498995 Transcript_155581/m.498995 type:complete len:176 (-) Transcript_155581:175-702(-)
MAKLQIFALLAAALACASASSSSPASSADLGAAAVVSALAEDDQCSTEGEEGAVCVLNALQLRATKAAAEHAAHGGDAEEGNACTSGIVGDIRKLSPRCLDACPQICVPLGVAVNAFMTKGGQHTAKQVVCQYKTEFACALQGSVLGHCKILIKSAASFGMKLPNSISQLSSGCR